MRVQDLFNTGENSWRPKVLAIYTRSINKPIWASKIIGQAGKLKYGYLGAVDQDTYLIIPFSENTPTINVKKSYSNIFRTKYSLNEGAYIGVVLSERKYLNSGKSTLYGIDGLYRFNNNLSLDYQLFISETIEPNDTTGYSILNGIGVDSYTPEFNGEKIKGNSAYFSLERARGNWGANFIVNQLS